MQVEQDNPKKRWNGMKLRSIQESASKLTGFWGNEVEMQKITSTPLIRLSLEDLLSKILGEKSCKIFVKIFLFFNFPRQRLSEIGLKVADFERELDMIMLQIGERLN